LILKWDLIFGILMGTIIGGTSSFIVLPIVQKIGVSEKIVSLLNLETIFTDVIVIVLTTTFLDAFTSVNVEYLEMVQSFISTFSIGAILGIMFGVLWLKVLNYLENEDYNSVLTLSVTFLLYGITELVGGNGVMFVLFYSLILGNGIEIRNVLRMKETREIDVIMRNIIPLINFFIRTYFFFYLGLILFIENINIIVHGIAICVLLLLGRYMGIQLISFNDSEIRSNQNTFSYIMPRGITAAIIAILVTQTMPNSAAILNIVIIVITISLIVSSIGRFMIVRRKVDD
jgi:cell volume regulation protein A